MTTWNIKRFGNMYSIPSRNGLMRPSAVRGKGYKMINMGELFAYSRIKNPPMELVELDEEEKKNFNIVEGDLLFARQSLVAEGAGKCSIVIESEKPTTFESHLIRVRLNKLDADSLFYYYYFRSQAGFGSIQSLVNQVSAAGIRGSDLSRLKVLYPSLPIQNKIAAILSTYDDLIENNNRRIAILENIAEELYREWFVRLRFPEHEKVKIVKGVPEGWEVKKIGTTFSTYLGGTPSRENSSFWGGDIPWINSGEVNNPRIIKETEFITQAGYDSSATKLMPIHTTVLAITGATLGQVSFTEIKVCANQSVVGICDEADVYNFYIYGFIRASIPIIISKQGGGGQQHINKDIVEKELIIVPPAQLVKCYNQKASLVFERTAKLYFSNEILKKSRDRLLSRLMSGKIDVENMDIKFPASMQEELAHA